MARGSSLLARLRAWQAEHRKAKRRFDYNRLADERSLQGWSFDELVAVLVGEAAQQYNRCGCTNPRACHHAAAADLDAILRIVYHPSDCPECARLSRRHEDDNDP